MPQEELVKGISNEQLALYIGGGIATAAVVGGIIYLLTQPPPPPPSGGAPLTVQASASPTSGNAPLTVSFTANVSGGSPPYHYTWDFGDQSPTSSEQNPTHTYQTAGTYTATLTVVDSAGNKAQQSITITVTSKLPPSPLTVSASATPTSGQVPLNVSFQANVSGGSTPYSFFWDFGDGSNSTQQNPTHTYTSPGVYIAVIRVSDSAGNITFNSIYITATASTGYQAQISAMYNGNLLPSDTEITVQDSSGKIYADALKNPLTVTLPPGKYIASAYYVVQTTTGQTAYYGDTSFSEPGTDSVIINTHAASHGVL